MIKCTIYLFTLEFLAAELISEKAFELIIEAIG